MIPSAGVIAAANRFKSVSLSGKLRKVHMLASRICRAWCTGGEPITNEYSDNEQDEGENPGAEDHRTPTLPEFDEHRTPALPDEHRTPTLSDVGGTWL